MILKIAFRNVLRQRRRTVLTMLTMMGGFTLASVSIGWSDGTYGSIIDTFTRNRLGHIQVHEAGYLDRPSLYKVVKDYQTVGKKIASVDGVVRWAPRIYAAGLASFGNKSAGIRITGVDPELETAATRFDKKIILGSMFSESATNEAMIGSGLAKTLKADVGDTIVVVSQAADGSIANDLYDITGVVKTGDPLVDQAAFYLPLPAAQELLVLPDQVHEIAVIARNASIVGPLVKSIRTKLNDPELDVSPWQKFAESFYRAMKADQSGMWISLLIIILIVAIGVLNTVLMAVLERTREYGLLKALGSRPSQVFKLVLFETNIMAIGSIFVGFGVALLANHILSIHGISIPEPLTYGGIEFQTMYAEINVRCFVIPAITVLVAASLVAVFPAIRAARTEAAKAMRMH